MGVFVGYYDWRAPIDWEQKERLLENVFAASGRLPQYYVYQTGTRSPKIFERSSVVNFPPDKFALLGIYNCGSGPVDLPNALSEAVFFRDHLGSSFCHFDREKSFDECKDRAIDVLKDIVEALPGGEGFAFELTELGPEGYMAGEITLKMRDREVDAVTSWMTDRRDATPRSRWRLRDVFPVNVLSSALASRKVTSTLKFEDWIAQSPERGSVSQEGSDNLLWVVDKKDIPQVKLELDLAGLIY